MGGGQCQTHMNTPRGLPGTKASLRPPNCWTADEEDVLWWVLGCGFLWKALACVLSLGGVTWKCRQMSDLFYSHKSSASSGFNTCCPSQGDQGKAGGVSTDNGHSTSRNSSSCSSGAGAGLSASPNLTEAPISLVKESSLEPALVPATEKELTLENASEALAETAHPLPSEKLVSPPSTPH